MAFTTLSKFIVGEAFDGVPVIATEDLHNYFNMDEISVINTVGYSKMNTIREKAQAELEEFGFKIGNYHSKNAYIYTDKIGPGNIILPGAFIGPHVELGKCNIIYSNVSLTHHISIGNFNFIASGCVFGGNVKMGDNCFVGLNSTVRNRINIPSYTLIGCASNIVKSIDVENSVWIGNPAKRIDNNESLDCIIK